ncbi:MAG TPA: hypothetical protein VFS04_07845 [Alphaproteobacteria bacterium]|nr:hypothetical protein [Alphaproteobacteria bacterium]
MAKKGESDEKVQAGTGPETLGENVPGEPDQREAAALVAGGDPGAIEGEGAELPPGEPADAAGQGAGVVSDADEQPAPVVPAGDPPAGEPDAQGTDQAAAGLAPDGEGHVEDGGDLAAGAPAAVTDAVVPSPADVFVAALLEAAGRPPAGTPEKLDGGELDDGPIVFGDLALGAAVETYQAVLMAGAILGASIAGTDALDADMSDLAYDDMAAFVRKIGKRATPEVMGQQLKILGHRASAEISEPERMALSAFVTALVDLDAFAAAEAARIAAETNPPAPAPAVPIDETTLEPVDDYFDTWA